MFWILYLATERTLQLERPLSIIPSSLVIFQRWKQAQRREQFAEASQLVRGRARTRTRPPQDSQFGALSTDPAKCSCLERCHVEMHFMPKVKWLYQTHT